MIFVKNLYLLRFFPSAPDQLRTFRISLNLFIEDTLLADRFSVFLWVITDIRDSVLADLAFSFVEKRMAAKLGI